ncbi:hypothetical protein GQ600_23199 [Phytophthora cactorum]|nr:hypothetical protein GQ600_23199 [Phytophthora cactorum]
MASTNPIMSQPSQNLKPPTDLAQDAQFDHQRSTLLSVSSSDLPFHLQGDKDFNEASAMAKRRALRFSEAVKTRIEFLWEVAGGRNERKWLNECVSSNVKTTNEQDDKVSVVQQQEVMERNSFFLRLKALDEQDYMALMLLIFKVLRDDFVLEIAHKQIQCDWEVDSHHGKTLSFDQFFAAVFELVDVWTCDVEEATYERFCHLLALRITRRVAVFMNGAELKLSLSDSFDPEVVAKAIPLRTVPKFVSVARVVAAIGVNTVGDLARADPKVVERNRIDFIQRNNGGVVPNSLSEVRKIGQDLQILLEMFKSIALQFENINYVLDNNVLRRLPKTAAPAHRLEKTEENLMRPSLELVSVMGTTPKNESLRTEKATLELESTAILARLGPFLVLPEETARDRYNALYDLLVLRDGESLKSLAAVMLKQIKLELSKHEAQRWIEETVQDNKVNDYIQHDFHELKSIDEVQLLGTDRGDEEFLALLAKDDDNEDDVVPVGELLPLAPTDQVPAPVNDEVDHDTGGKKRKKKQAKKKDSPRGADILTHLSLFDGFSRFSKISSAVVEDGDLSGDHRKEKSVTTVPTDAVDVVEPDDAKRNRSTLPSRHGRPNTELEIDTSTGEKNHHDVSEQHTARDALNVAIELEEENTVQETGARVGHVGNRVILFGGNPDEPERNPAGCVGMPRAWALYFATIPFNFPRLREKIISFFENSKQPYILRQRKPPGQTAQMGSSIGTGSLFALHDEPRRVSTSVAFAKTPRRKVAVATPALPSLSHSPREIPQSSPQGLSEPRHADFTPIAPSTPRSSQSRNRSPRFSTALNKLIRDVSKSKGLSTSLKLLELRLLECGMPANSEISHDRESLPVLTTNNRVSRQQFWQVSRKNSHLVVPPNLYSEPEACCSSETRRAYPLEVAPESQ